MRGIRNGNISIRRQMRKEKVADKEEVVEQNNEKKDNKKEDK
jgi:hypothetical protein